MCPEVTTQRTKYVPRKHPVFWYAEHKSGHKERRAMNLLCRTQYVKDGFVLRKHRVTSRETFLSMVRFCVCNSKAMLFSDCRCGQYPDTFSFHRNFKTNLIISEGNMKSPQAFHCILNI